MATYGQKSHAEDGGQQQSVPPSAPISPSSGPYLSGWRLWVTITAAFVGFFLSLLDTTIVAVSLPSIANHFEEFDRSTWVINAYLIAYMGTRTAKKLFSETEELMLDRVRNHPLPTE